jgi:hypothetical protein
MTASSLPDIAKMKASEIRQELESYGISTKSFFEKSELVEALQKARLEGKTPVSPERPSSGQEARTTRNSAKSASSSSAPTRDIKYQQALEKAQSMKVSELRTALQDMGISTKSFFEKSEFVKAYADGVADGKQSGSGNRSNSARSPDEPYDPSYRDVVMQKFNGRDPRLLQGSKVIDVKAVSAFS